MNARNGGKPTYPIVGTVFHPLLMQHLPNLPAFAYPRKVRIGLNNIHGARNREWMYLISVPPAFTTGHHYRRHGLINGNMFIHSPWVVMGYRFLIPIKFK